MMCRRILSLMTLAMAASGMWSDWAARLQGAPVEKLQVELKLKKEIDRRKFTELKAALLRVAQRLAQSEQRADRERALTIRKAIELASKEGVDTQFQHLIASLHSSKNLTVGDLNDIIARNRELVKDIRAVIQILLSDDRAEKINKEITRIRDIVRALNRAIWREKLNRARAEGEKVPPSELRKAENENARHVDEIADKMKPDGDLPELPGRRRVQEARNKQRSAANKFAEGNQKGAIGDQSDAIDELENVKKQLEEILKQLRKEEVERILASLIARCERMLQMQREVREATGDVDKALKENPDRGAPENRGHIQKALELSKEEALIAVEAVRMLQLLQAEGSTVAIPHVVRAAHDDMKIVQRRLEKADTGQVTQAIEDDIIATLEDLIAALKKAQKDLNDPPHPHPHPEPPPKSDKNNEPKLVDQLAELKVIRAMQVRVNRRTRMYSQFYNGEQASEPDIRKELENLAVLQKGVYKVTNDIYRGRNK
ncbi:MAG: hypothetical protein KatS3mg105_3593 [Gemmatales bacterium]|nr:MAG: hypothetical protein KatS3mg105_3593 [Gemmatales bacterium]